MIIFKYKIPENQMICHFTWPAGSEILHVAEQNGRVFAWVKHHNPDNPPEHRKVYCVMTGHHFDVDAPFISTVQLYDGTFVIHFFDGGVDI